jgi:hypothetical protein
MDELSEREQHIAAAAYLKGLAVGLSIDRSKTWHRQVEGSELATTTHFEGLDDFLRDGRGFNPIAIIQRREFAQRCGLRLPHHAACQVVANLLHRR